MNRFSIGFAIAFPLSVAICVVGFFCAFSYGMSHHSGTPAWEAWVGYLAFWPSILLNEFFRIECSIPVGIGLSLLIWTGLLGLPIGFCLTWFGGDETRER
jgi:hypothetical protein